MIYVSQDRSVTQNRSITQKLASVTVAEAHIYYLDVLEITVPSVQTCPSCKIRARQLMQRNWRRCCDLTFRLQP